jgi:hypothetical protein
MQPCQNKEGLCKQKELLGKINDDGKGLKWSAETPEGTSSSKVVTKNGQAILDFAREASALKGNDTKKIVLDIDKKQVNTIKEALGIDLSKFKRVFESGYIRHALKNHGKWSKDKKPITDDDFLRYEDIVTNPDRVSKSKTDDNKPAIVYVKRYDDAVYVVEELRATVDENRNRLVFRTMFKNSLKTPDESIRNPKNAGELKFVDIKNAQMLDAEHIVPDKLHVRNDSALKDIIPQKKISSQEVNKAQDSHKVDIDQIATQDAVFARELKPSHADIIPQTKSSSQKYDDMIDRFWDKAANAFEWVDKKILAAGINKIGKLFGKEFGVKRVLTIENSVKEISAMINDFRNGRIQLNEEAAGIRDFLDKNLSKDELRDLIRALHGDSDASLLSANLKGIYDDLTARAIMRTQGNL